MPVDAELRSHGSGHKGLHVASYHGHAAIVKALLDRGASVTAIDKTWGTPPLIWALTRWAERPDWGDFYSVVTELVAAGAPVRKDLLEWDKARADPKMLAALQTTTGGTLRG